MKDLHIVKRLPFMNNILYSIIAVDNNKVECSVHKSLKSPGNGLYENKILGPLRDCEKSMGY